MGRSKASYSQCCAHYSTGPHLEEALDLVPFGLGRSEGLCRHFYSLLQHNKKSLLRDNFPRF